MSVVPSQVKHRKFELKSPALKLYPGVREDRISLVCLVLLCFVVLTRTCFALLIKNSAKKDISHPHGAAHIVIYRMCFDEMSSVNDASLVCTLCEHF